MAPPRRGTRFPNLPPLPNFADPLKGVSQAMEDAKTQVEEGQEAMKGIVKSADEGLKSLREFLKKGPARRL